MSEINDFGKNPLVITSKKFKHVSIQFQKDIKQICPLPISGCSGSL